MYGMTTSVHAGSVSLFGVVLPIYIFSVLCQGLRAYQYCRVGKEKGLYKPWLGPDFSRWLEYLFTSPLQIFVVATAFGFANSDTVTGLCGMQSALVLFGYDIEQQIKKIYKREVRPVDGYHNIDSEDQHLAPRRVHNILWNAGIRDIRGGVYLAVAWLLHSLIWVSIFNRYSDQQTHGNKCGTDLRPAIPDVVTFLMWLQCVAFSLFGVVNTVQFGHALYLRLGHKQPVGREKQAQYWNFVSMC